MTPVLETRAITVRYRRGPDVLTDVSVTVPEGHGLAVVGESGAGKTTLTRILLGLLRPLSGAVLLDGAAIDGRLSALRRAVQPVFQDCYSSLDPRQRVDRIVAEPLRSLGLVTGPDRRAELARRVAEALSCVGLPEDAARRYPHEFSGGQRQRIAIARAIAGGHRVLIADEPFSALDAVTTARLVDLLSGLRERRGLTVILVTHDLAVAAALCARTAVLERGRIVEHGETAAVLGRPRHPHTRKLVASVPRLPS
ncbi:ABC transporter ATP-binding protein [Streptosporangiaceae bacterium NEAU-GS5]|nr:ABC transporter ATP-binding protein [Streptosporangiaceae bacterium NEAU-GS5]